jgi:hypothetical protein
MVMKDIAARPVDKANIGVKVGLPVKFIGFAGVQQHVGKRATGILPSTGLRPWGKRGPEKTRRSAPARLVEA